jgi:hypothetical protein
MEDKGFKYYGTGQGSGVEGNSEISKSFSEAAIASEEFN